MKVIQILPELNSGGVERGTCELAEYLVDQGHESIIISNGGRLVTQIEASGSRHVTLPVHRKNLSSLLQIPKLRKIFIREKPDIIHVRSRVPAWLSWLAWKSIPAMQRPHFVSTFHGFYSVNQYSKIMTRGEVVIAVSPSIKNHIETEYQIDSSKIYEIPRGIDPEEYHFDYKPTCEWLDEFHQAHPHAKGKILLTLPGRLTRLKGHRHFIDLIANLKNYNVHGLIVGGAHLKKNEYHQEIKSYIIQKNLSNQISLTGHRSDLKNILAISQIVYSLSSQPEAFGRTILEALSLGKPVIAWDEGGASDIMNKLFPLGLCQKLNHELLLKKTEDILATCPTPLANHIFTKELMLKNTIRCYSNLLDLKLI